MPCIYCGEKTGLVAEVQQDGLHVAGMEKELIQFKQNLSKGVSLKLSFIVMQGMRYTHLEREGMVLRDRTCDLGDARPSWGTLCMEECNSLYVPVTTTRSAGEQASADYLSEVETSIICRCVGLLRYLRSACGELIVVAKELSRGLAKPTMSDVSRLKKMARYLKGAMGLATWPPTLMAFEDLGVHRQRLGQRQNHQGKVWAQAS